MNMQFVLSRLKQSVLVVLFLLVGGVILLLRTPLTLLT